MLVFSDNAWHVIIAFLVFLSGYPVVLIQRKVFCVPVKRALALYVWHSFFCIFYFWYSLDNAADATLYYIRSLGYDDGFRFGTAGIYFIVSFLSQGLSFSYGNTFLVFNIFGYVGLLAFASALQTATTNNRRDIRTFSVLFLYLPGISFWSSAIGKDALTFMAAGLVTWAALDIGRRMPAIVVGGCLFLLPRPHIAGILLISICIALLASSKLGALKKAALLSIAIPLSVVGTQFGLSYAGLGEASDLSDVNAYFETRQGHNLGGGSSVDIAGMPVPLRLFTYLFRPLVFDANGIMGLIVSFENLALLALFLMVIFKRKRSRSGLSRFSVIFYFTFTVISWFILANTTANLGIAVRQKSMFLPMLVVLLFSMCQRNPTKSTGNGLRT